MHIEFDISQNGGHDIFSYLLGFGFHDDFFHFLRHSLLVDGHGVLTEVAPDGGGDSLEAEEVVPISWNLDLINSGFRHIDIVPVTIHSHHVHLFSVTELDLESELEAEVLELLVSYLKKILNLSKLLTESLTDKLKKLISDYVYLWHVFMIFLNL